MAELDQPRPDAAAVAARMVEQREELDAVLAGIEVRGVRAQAHVHEGRLLRTACLAHVAPVLALLAAGVLSVGRDRGPAVGAEADLDHLPVALVEPDPGQALVVVVVEEPVLQPHAATVGLDVAAVDLVGVARLGLHPSGVLLIRAAMRVEVVGRQRLRALGTVGVAGEEVEVEAAPDHRRARLRDQLARLGLQVGGIPADHEAVRHDPGRTRPVGLLLVVGDGRRVLGEQSGAARGVERRAHGCVRR